MGTLYVFGLRQQKKMTNTGMDSNVMPVYFFLKAAKLRESV